MAAQMSGAVPMQVSGHYRQVGTFYIFSTAIPWAFWLAAAAIGVSDPVTPANLELESVLGLIGLVAPMAAAFALILRDPVLREDIAGRIFNFKSAKPIYWLASVAIMPVSILLAMAISVPLGYSTAQFQLAAHASFTSGIFPVWFLLLLAPTLEELGWHTYGTDCLCSRFRLITASLLFAVYWAIWHMPLALIRGYYQANLLHQSVWDALNFPLSIVPFVVLMNWLYYRTGRNILVAIVFHITSGYFNELFASHPDSKIIQTGLLLALAVAALIADRRLFFAAPNRVLSAPV